MTTVNVQFRADISLEDLMAALTRIVTAGGCPACGLNGFDLQLGVDPVDRLRDAFRGVEFVRQINVLPSLHEMPGFGPGHLG